ncbi:acyltransferase family protein [Rhizobium sp. P38BS-XIX]|uniref:acyltransferase family protein n=1 Tax=Rhizobium sp. P38BS-XIX TaxID=2726740 RepID=UPI0014573298|nr:acyltransferase family protein [Rhizobium sp. P38BS-XIX]NLR97758.1 acyltransferase family protein [Rhizobium sp. P38BS-XIX]
MGKLSRRHDLDFVRVAAFMLLIVYHVSLMYNSREYLFKAPDPSSIFDLIYLWTHPWRMTLLFFVSGTVTGILLPRQAPQVLRNERTRQLLVPFLLGVIFLVPPQVYVWLNTRLGVEIGLMDVFWHYVTLTPVSLPGGEQTLLVGMQHLWYLAYLWFYTALLAFAVSLRPLLLAQVGDRLVTLLSGKRLLFVPTFVFILLRLMLRPAFPPSLNILTDWYSHSAYMLAFFLGAVMASRDDFWRAIVDIRKLALLLAVLCAAILAIVFPVLPSDATEMWRLLVGRVATGAFQWSAVVAILGHARVWCALESRIVIYLNRAILTYYVLHQTVMLLIAYALDQMGWMSAASFLPITVATLAVCALLYELQRRLRASWRVIFQVNPA